MDETIETDGWDDGIPNVSDDLKPRLNDFKHATSLVLPSGGVKGVYLLGALHYLHEQCGLNHIQSYYGTSIGSIISGLLIIGFTPMEILVLICVKKIIGCLIEAFNVGFILTETRLIDTTVFTALLTEVIHDKVGYIPTLGELYTRFQKKLCIVTISRDKPQNPIYMSSDSHPNVSMVHALHMSSSIPFVFGYAKYDGLEYFDGGVLDQFPILYASEREERVFGIDIVHSYTKSDILWKDMWEMIYLPITFIGETFKKQLIRGTYIEINTDNEILVTTSTGLLNMFTSGYKQCIIALQETQFRIQKEKIE